MNQFHYKAKTNVGDIEAIRYSDTQDSEATKPWPRWLVLAIQDGHIYTKPGAEPEGEDFVRTQDGLEIELDDSMWLIKLNDGELTACSDSLFQTLFTKSI